MKKILSIVIAAIFVLPNMAAAEKTETIQIIEPDKNGIVTVPAKIAPDNLEHKLIDIDTDSAALVQSVNNVTTFSTLNFNYGLLDTLNPNKYKVSISTGIDISTIFNNNSSVGMALGRGEVSVTFSDVINFTGMYLHHGSSPLLYLTYSFYLDDKLVLTSNGKTSYSEAYINTNVKANKFTFKSSADVYFREFDLFGDVEIDYIAATDLEITNVKDNEALLTYKKPNSQHYTKTGVLLDDKLIVDNASERVSLKDLDADTEYIATVRSYYADGNYIDTKKKFKTAKDVTPPKEVTELKAKQRGDTFKLTYKLPPDKDFDYVEIYRNGKWLVSLHDETEYIDEKPVLNGNNVYKLITVDKSGNKSNGESVTVKHTGINVYNVKAAAKDFTAVELSWNNPERSDFENVTIYRKDPSSGIIARVMSFFSVGDGGYKPLFQTNGTTFKDMTVAADTTYSYKLNTVVSGTEEEEGVTVSITTPKASVVGGEVEQDANKDYVFKWTAPTKGKVKVIIAGNEYKTVSASSQQITIPASIMKYDFTGAPQVTLVPVDEQGNEGVPTKPPGTSGSGMNIGGGTQGKVELPSELSAKNLLLMGVQLLGVVGGFVLIGLAFKLTPKLMRVIGQAFEARRAKHG